MATERHDQDLLQYVPAPTQEYNPDHGEMPEVEKVALNTLADAVRSIARAYVYQSNRPFYPNVSRERIIEAARTNPDILSEYTVVEQDEDGGLKAVPYHEAFKPQLTEVSRQLRDAAYYTRDLELRWYLLARSRNLLDGNYEESERLWLTSPMTKIRVVIGPYDRYKDTRFNRKYSFGGFVGTLDEEKTEKHQPVVDDLVDAYMNSSLQTVPSFVRPKVRIRYDRTEVSGGLPAEMEWTANSLPCQPGWREKYGTEIIMLEPSFFDKFHRFRLPLIREVISVERRRSQSDSELEMDYALRYDAHETMHALIRRAGDEQRFGSEYSFMSEMSATTIGLSMLQRTGLPAKQLEGILAVELAIAADEYRNYKNGKREREGYLKGEAVLFRSLIKDGVISINERGEVNWADIKSVYESIDSWAHVLETLLTKGDIDDARKLKNTLGDPSIFDELKPFKPFDKLPAFLTVEDPERLGGIHIDTQLPRSVRLAQES